MLERVSVDPRVHFGKPCVRGTRIPVHRVLELVEEGLAFDKIVSDFYPEITIDDVRACVHYASALLRGEEVHVEGQ